MALNIWYVGIGITATIYVALLARNWTRLVEGFYSINPHAIDHLIVAWIILVLGWVLAGLWPVVLVVLVFRRVKVLVTT